MKKVILLLMVFNVGMIVHAGGGADTNSILPRERVRGHALNGRPSSVGLYDFSRIGNTDYYDYTPYLDIHIGSGAYTDKIWAIALGYAEASFEGYQITLTEVNSNETKTVYTKDHRIKASSVNNLAISVRARTGAKVLKVKVSIRAKYRADWGEDLYSRTCYNDTIYKLDVNPPAPPVITIDGSESTIYNPNVSIRDKYHSEEIKYYFIGKGYVQIPVGNLDDNESGNGRLRGKLERFREKVENYNYYKGSWDPPYWYRYVSSSGDLIHTNTDNKKTYTKTVNTSPWVKNSVYKIKLYNFDRSSNVSYTETLFHTDFTAPTIKEEDTDIAYTSIPDNPDWYSATISTKITDTGAGVNGARVELYILSDTVSLEMKEKNDTNGTELKKHSNYYYKILLKENQDGTFSTPLIINAAQTIKATIRAYDNVTNFVEKNITLAISRLPIIKLSSIDYNVSLERYSFPYTINYTETGEGIKYIDLTLKKKHYADAKIPDNVVRIQF